MVGPVGLYAEKETQGRGGLYEPTRHRGRPINDLYQIETTYPIEVYGGVL
jgi:hypothetical protein